MLHVCVASAILLSNLLVGAVPVDRQQAPAARQQRPVDPGVKRDGWWIRLNPESKVDKITWQYSEPGKKNKEPVTFTWVRSNDPNNFDLPEAVRLAEVLNLTMTAEPTNAPASFCVFFAKEGVQFVEFTGSRKGTWNSRSRDKSCIP